MEVVLDLGQSEHTEGEPLVCMDEAAIAIHSDVYFLPTTSRIR
jgi:hypothetical protein